MSHRSQPETVMPLRLCLTALLAAPAFAQDTPGPNLDPAARATPTAVAQLALAQDVYAQALAQNDPLAMLTAAKLAGAVDMAPVTRSPETTGQPAEAQPDSHSAPPAATAMLAQARAMVAEDDTLAALLTEAETGNSLVRAGTVSATPHTLPAGQTDLWHLPFDGGTLAGLAVLGDGDGNLDLTLTDANGLALCLETAPADRSACAFVPAATGYFTLTVQNHGPGRNSYLLLTN